MNDFEEALKELRLAKPSPELDRRIERAFAEAAVSDTQRRSVSLWLWAAAFAGATAMCPLLLRLPAPTPAPVNIQIEPRGALRQLLLEPPAARRLPPFAVRVEPS